MPQPDSSDAELAQRAANGCEDAASEIVSRYGNRIFAFLNKRNAHASGNEDILQETFITAFKRLHIFDPSQSFSAWMFGIARNKAQEHYRKSQRIERLHASASDQLVDPDTPSDLLERREQAARFWEQARTLLGADSFECLWLRYQEDLSITEIAETLGKQVSAVKVALFRARQTLASNLHEFQPNNPQAEPPHVQHQNIP